MLAISFGNVIKRKINIAVFISGRGTNLKALISRSKKRICNYHIATVVSNKRHASGLKFARKNKIPVLIISQKFLKIEQKNLAKTLIKRNVKLICLAGFIKILDSYFLDFFKKKIINIHPSLLPKYKGLNTHYKALKEKESFSGCTIHFVSKQLDSGKIIAKKRVKILKKDTVKKLEKRVLKAENKLYPLVVEKLMINL